MGTRIIRQTHYEPLPTGEYPAKIGAAVVESGQYGEQVKFRFDITLAGYAERSVIGWAGASFSPKSKLYKWTRAAFGRDIPPDYDVNLDHLIDKAVTLVLVVKTGDDGAEYNKIEDVKAFRRGGSAGPSTTAPGVITQTAPITAAGAAGLPSGRVPVNAGADGPDDLPPWLAGTEDDIPF